MSQNKSDDFNLEELLEAVDFFNEDIRQLAAFERSKAFQEWSKLKAGPLFVRLVLFPNIPEKRCTVLRGYTEHQIWKKVNNLM